MENSGSVERKRNNYIISRSGKFKSKNKKRIQITEEFWIDPVQSQTKQTTQPQQISNQDFHREIKDLHQQHTKSDNSEANLMRMFQNFTASTSSSAINNANNFIKSDKKTFH